MQDELILLDSVKLRQPSFGEGPEGLYAIDVAFAADELVAAIIDPVMVVAVEHVPVVGLPAVGVDRAALEHFALYRRQKSGPAHRGDKGAGLLESVANQFDATKRIMANALGTSSGIDLDVFA